MLVAVRYRRSFGSSILVNDIGRVILPCSAIADAGAVAGFIQHVVHVIRHSRAVGGPVQLAILVIAEVIVIAALSTDHLHTTHGIAVVCFIGQVGRSLKHVPLGYPV